MLNFYSETKNKLGSAIAETRKVAVSKNRINSIFEKIFASSSELFGISNKEVRIQETLPAEIELKFQTEDKDDLLGMTLNAVKKALPKIIVQKVIIKEAKDKTNMFFDRHCVKTHYDFSQRIERLVRNYKTIFGNSIENIQNDVLWSLEAGFSLKSKTQTEISRRKAELSKRISKLNDLRKSVKNILL
jgi:hypothetical protein